MTTQKLSPYFFFSLIIWNTPSTVHRWDSWGHCGFIFFHLFEFVRSSIVYDDNDVLVNFPRITKGVFRVKQHYPWNQSPDLNYFVANFNIHFWKEEFLTLVEYEWIPFFFVYFTLVPTHWVNQFFIFICFCIRFCRYSLSYKNSHANVYF